MSGTLFLLPCPIAAGSLGAALPAEVIAIARRLGHFLVEDAKTARALLKELAHPQPMRELSIVEIGHAPRGEDIEAWLAPVLAGRDVAIVSEAGCPGIADPGGTIVAGAHARGIRVRPLVGPSSILLALMAAGLDGQRFRFHGYLPIPADARTTCLKALERESKSRTETQVFIETPYRNAALWQAMLQALKPQTRVAVASALTLPAARCRSASVAEWKQQAVPVGNHLPAVFALGM